MAMDNKIHAKILLVVCLKKLILCLFLARVDLVIQAGRTPRRLISH